jgi:hypothetical protein
MVIAFPLSGGATKDQPCSSMVMAWLMVHEPYSLAPGSN